PVAQAQPLDEPAPPAPLPPLAPPLPPFPALPAAPPSGPPHSVVWGSGPGWSRAKNLTTALASMGVVWPPMAWVWASRTVKPHASCQFWMVKPATDVVSVVVGVAPRPRTLVHSLMASVWLL